ncbi:MAG: SUMF1/EgtB/PvdO family nonheme iron enzyme, partial [Proteobacteria bacterium]|nr:SUMF1/EgtB/PvdO family nonheme iron enzyme [Pseudomonadota bacterium]
GSGSASNTGAQSSCKTDLNVYDMAGNVSEWVDERMTAYSISGASETRFSYGPTIGRIVKNGIDNLTRRYHQVIPGANDLALALGANFSNTAPYGKQYGHDIETWQDPTVSATTIGFRCVAFPKGSMPTVTQLALPAEPIYTSADLPASTANWKVPENLYLKDTKPEAVTITVTQANASNTTVAEGSVSLTWDAWSKCTSALAGGCTSSTSGITYEVYRYIEPVKQDIRMATIWALNETDAGGTAATNPYATGIPMDPLAVDSANTPLVSPVASGSDITCTSGVCSWTDNVSFDTKRLYNYLVVAKDTSGSAVPARIQMYRSPYFTGDKASVASAFFRTELRLRRASVMLVDEDFQQAQTNPQIMVHVPLDKSGLDHDFYIQKYEAASTAGVTNDTGAANNPESAVGMNTNTWKNDAAVCQETFLRTMSFSASCGSFTSNSTGTVLLSKQGTTPVVFINQGHSWRACHNTGVSDSSGSPYYLALPTNAEWNKAADWGDVDLTGTIKQHVLLALVGTTIEGLEATITSPSGTCNSDTNVASTSASAARLNCQSRYGVSELVGSVTEWVLDRTYANTGLDNGVDGLWLSHALKSSAGQNASPTGFDLLRGTVPAVKTEGADIVYALTGDIYNQNAALGGSRRGGRYDLGRSGGRWTLLLSLAPSLTGANLGTRCSR